MSYGPRPGSLRWKLTQLRVGESCLLDAENTVQTQQRVSAEVTKIRRDPDWVSCEFRQALFYGVSPTTREVLVVDRVTRIA